jgi:hypothetical protein
MSHAGFDRVVTLLDWPQDAMFPLLTTRELSLECQIKQVKDGQSATDLSPENMRIEFLLETLH